MNYVQIFKLKSMLEKAKIPFDFESIYGGYLLCYPSNIEKSCACSVIEHKFSYGFTNGLLEIMGLLTNKEFKNDEVVGYLTAEEVFNRINKHWKNDKRRI